MSDLWIPGAERIKGSHSAGLAMSGGGAFATHHITVTAKGSYDGAKAVLLREGYEPTLIVDPTLGKIGQFLPANRGGYALQHVTVETNTAGRVHVQIEWVWPNMLDDITKAPHFDECWDRVVTWLRRLGVPDLWPFGFHGSSRAVSLWDLSGHRGHINAPGNSHVDNLPAKDPPPWPVRRSVLRRRLRAAVRRVHHLRTLLGRRR